MYAIQLLLHMLLVYNGFEFARGTVVVTTTGPVKGKQNSFGSITFTSYEGIPYAEPPIGDLRFRPPVPKCSWDYELDATSPGYVCPQPPGIYQTCDMDENCLFLNIYVPACNSNSRMPVFLFIHGGYYMLGSGNPKPIYGPGLLLGKSIVVVTVNYRLGALGFLSLDNEAASGNAGLKDILLALKWIDDNIERFGGDPKSKCLVGDSSGASLVHYLTLINETTGLFQSAIISSGSALGYRDLQIDPKANAIKLAKQLGIEYNNDHSLLEQLKCENVFSIIDAQQYIIENDPQRAFASVNLFAPCVEKPSSVALIRKNPLDIVREEGLVQKVPILTGFNNQEGLEVFSIIKDDPTLVDQLNENFELCIPSNIKYPDGSQKRKDLAASIRQFYFDGGNISIFNTQNYINLITDTSYSYGLDLWIKTYKLKERSSPIYYYNFELDGDLNFFKLFTDITFPGASHADNLGYVFVTNVTEDRLQDLDCKSAVAENKILNYITNLTVYGNPTPRGSKGVLWVEAGPERQHLVYENGPRNSYEPPTPDRLEFWYKEYAKYYDYETSCIGM